MRLILYSDMQAAPGNLEECDRAHQEVLAAIDKWKPDAAVFLGDGKEVYDPLPGSVVKAWIRYTREISSKLPFYALMGNHDRFSQSIDSDNWMDVMHAAGAKTISAPLYSKALNAVFIPYAHTAQLRTWAEKLDPVNDETILFFHCEVVVADLGYRSTTGITPEELGVPKYAAAFGGHIHQFQQFQKKAWYVGSPFCQDWGEADQTKGIVLVDIKGGYPTVTQIKTKIPHWYNFDYLQSTGKIPEQGAYVRVRVPITTKKVMDELRAAENELLQQYGKINVFAVPEIEKKDSDLEIISQGANDEEMLAQYVASTLPEAARFKPEDVIEYLQATLPESPAAAVQGLRFISCEAYNVLCFEQIKLRYAKQGLILLKGINRQWPRRSNGAGKSSALSLLTIAIAGQTVKGQTTDEWASEFNDAPSTVYLKVRGANGKLYEVERGRRPHKLILNVDGVDRSSGVTGTSKGQTQGRIEAFLGLSMKSLLNSVYIDQSVANGFLFGTQKDRMDLVAKLQNLDRFETALKAATADAKSATDEQTSVSREIDRLKERYTILLESYRAQVEEEGSALVESADKMQQEIDELAAHHVELASHADFYKDLQADIDSMAVEYRDSQKKYDSARAQLRAVKNRIPVVVGLIQAGKCSICGNPTTALNQNELMELKEKKDQFTASQDKWFEAMDTLETKRIAAQKRLDKFYEELKQVIRDLEKQRQQLADMDSSLTEERERIATAKRERKEARKNIKALVQQIKGARLKYKKISIRVELLEYAKKAFHRNGIPLALSIALCPKLNAAAEEFSEIFNSGKVKVRFAVVNGDFDVEVVNTAGSGKANGQSVGEAAMAGVITAFALREAAPRTNLLVLDEPGHGLDAEGQREFAHGILKIKDKYETIIMTTHSQIIESILSGETVWTVEKENRVSHLYRT